MPSTNHNGKEEQVNWTNFFIIHYSESIKREIRHGTLNCFQLWHLLRCSLFEPIYDNFPQSKSMFNSNLKSKIEICVLISNPIGDISLTQRSHIISTIIMRFGMCNNNKNYSSIGHSKTIYRNLQKWERLEHNAIFKWNAECHTIIQTNSIECKIIFPGIVGRISDQKISKIIQWIFI